MESCPSPSFDRKTLEVTTTLHGADGEDKMESCPSPTFDQKTFEVTATLHGADGGSRSERRKRNRRSLGRRVSFAEAPAYHIFARDDEYVSPSHDKKGAEQVVVGTVPCSESKRPPTSNLDEGRKSYSSPSVGSSSWHPAINTSNLYGDADGEFSSFVATPDTSCRQRKEHAIDEDVTLESSAFLSLIKGKSLPVEDMLVESPPSLSGNKEPLGRIVSPDGEDMSMWIPNVIRPNTLDAQPGSNGSFSDMSLTVQVQRKCDPSLSMDGEQSVLVLEEQGQNTADGIFRFLDIIPKERDQNVSNDIPTLRALAHEGDDDDMVTEMQMETAVISKRQEGFDPERSVTDGGVSFPGAESRLCGKDDVASVEEEGSHQVTFFEGQGSDLRREQHEPDRSITLAVPSLGNIIREDVDDSALGQEETASKNVMLPSSQYGTRSLPTFDREVTESITTEVPHISDVLAADTSGSITAQVPRISDLLAAESTGNITAQVPEFSDLLAGDTSDLLATDSASPYIESEWNRKKRRSSLLALAQTPTAAKSSDEDDGLGKVCVTPLSDASMEIVDERSERIVGIRIPPATEGKTQLSMEANTPFDANLEVVDSGDTASTQGEFNLPLIQPSEVICALENIDSEVVGLRSSTISEVPENVSPASSSGSKMDQVETPTDRSERMEIAVESSPIPRAHDAQELISSVLRSSARVTPTPTTTLDQKVLELRHSIKKSRIGGSGNEPQQGEASSYQTEPQRSVFAEHITTPVRKDIAHQVQSPPDSMRIESSSTQQYQHLSTSAAGQTGESEKAILGKLEGKLTRKEKGKAESRTECQVIRREGVEQTSFLLGKSHERVMETRNISVEEFLKLAQVEFSPKAWKSGPLVSEISSLQACDVTDYANASRYLLLVCPQDEVYAQACYKLNEIVESVPISNAKLEEAISASNPPLFLQFQAADAEEKQQLYKRIHHLRRKCSLKAEKDRLEILLGLEEGKRSRQLESKEEIQAQEQEVCYIIKEVRAINEQNQVLEAEIRARTKKCERVPSAQEKPVHKGVHLEEAHRRELYLEQINFLKEKLAEINTSKKVKHGKLLRRAQMAEESCKNLKEDLKARRLREDQLQTQLVENVHKAHSQAESSEILAIPRFYVKEMIKKLSRLKQSQGGLVLKFVQYDILELSYPPIIKSRLTLVESASGKTVVTKSTWDLDLKMIELVFPGINAPEAFHRTLTDGADYLTRSPQKLRVFIQKISFVVNNLLAFMAEVFRCADGRNAVVGKTVSVAPRFYSENDKDLQLEIKFMDCLVSAKIVLTLDVRIAQLNGYPFGDVPVKISQFFCPRRFSHTLSAEGLEAAIAAVKLGCQTVEPGYQKVERVCVAVGSFLGSVEK